MGPRRWGTVAWAAAAAGDRAAAGDQHRPLGVGGRAALRSSWSGRQLHAPPDPGAADPRRRRAPAAGDQGHQGPGPPGAATVTRRPTPGRESTRRPRGGGGARPDGLAHSHGGGCFPRHPPAGGALLTWRRAERIPTTQPAGCGLDAHVGGRTDRLRGGVERARTARRERTTAQNGLHNLPAPLRPACGPRAWARLRPGRPRTDRAAAWAAAVRVTWRSRRPPGTRTSTPRRRRASVDRPVAKVVVLAATRRHVKRRRRAVPEGPSVPGTWLTSHSVVVRNDEGRFRPVARARWWPAGADVAHPATWRRAPSLRSSRPAAGSPATPSSRGRRPSSSRHGRHGGATRAHWARGSCSACMISDPARARPQRWAPAGGGRRAVGLDPAWHGSACLGVRR